jgi:hypothetical protein
MGEFNRDYAVDSTTGGTAAVTANSNRKEVIFRSQGSDRVFISFGEPCDGTGTFLDTNDAFIVGGGRAKCNVYMACANSGETAVVSIDDYPI